LEAMLGGEAGAASDEPQFPLDGVGLRRGLTTPALHVSGGRRGISVGRRRRSELGDERA
jgi:hypothetical protein